MMVHPLPPEALRTGQATPFVLRDANGALVAGRGLVIETEEQRQHLVERELYFDDTDHEHFVRAMEGKVDSMVRQNALLGAIAHAQPEVADTPGSPRRRLADPLASWGGLQQRAVSLLRDTPQEDFAQRLGRLQAELLDLLERDTDAALLILIQNTATDPRHYSAGHALLVAAVCELAAQHLAAWPGAWREPLRSAALTMNIAMTAVQDALALQDSEPTPQQRAVIDGHGERAAQRLRLAGIDDALWLDAVTHHHGTRAGALGELPPGQQLARLIQRADIFAARLSQRRHRGALSGMAAAKAIYLDENRQADEAGAAIIKATGIYPPGSYVRLANGEVAVVLRRGRLANQPFVASVLGSAGLPLAEPARRDTRSTRFAVSAGVPPQQIRLRLNLQRLLALT